MSAFASWFHSYRSQLQAAFLALGLGAIGVTGWEASESAASALRAATDERLTALLQTRGRLIENYFENLNSHVLALSADDATLTAIGEWRRAWASLPEAGEGSVARREVAAHYQILRFGERLQPQTWLPDVWLPDGRAALLQHRYIAANPHPPGSKDLLLEAPGLGAYDLVHRRYHPTFHRYQTAFGFYDIFLVDRDGRVLYTVFKEIDLGARLDAAPYVDTGLGRVYARAMKLTEAEQTVIEDFQPYAPSGLAPASFVAAPLWQGGVKVGALVIQVSVDEVNRLMSGEGNWRAEGFGETGEVYLAGSDGRLRSNTRREMERDSSGRRSAPSLAAGHPPAQAGHPVIRKTAQLRIPGLDWKITGEIETDEALAPVTALRRRIQLYALVSAIAVLAAARWLGNRVTRRLTKLAEVAGKLGGREMDARVAVEGRDEIAGLAETFNRMAESLQRTTVSKDEWQELAGRLISAQEEERQRVARELHDDLTQRLAAVAIDAGRLEKVEEQGAAPGAARELAARIKHQMAALSTDVHGLSRRLHPSTLDDLGLAAALEAECRSFFERGGPPVELDIATGDASWPDQRLSREQRLALYRITQEGLRNVLRHARAESVRVRLIPEPGPSAAVRLEIEDDGRGFQRGGGDWKPGLGLASMQERARLAGGVLTIDTKPGAGTRLTVRMPSGQGENHEQQEASAAAGR